MAEIDSSRNVQQIPAGETLPRPYARREEIRITPFGDMQSAISENAASTNWMSAIGSEVASRASNAIAQQIGSELGKNPQGNLGLPITEFDKNMQESYRTQAQATLGLQANKLISDSNIETAKADRITPDLIAKTNQSISMGLKNIIKNAPSEIKPHLEYQYGTVQLNQHADLVQRMIKEQHQDRQNNTALASQQNAENAYSFGMRGNDKAAEAVIETTRRLSDADVASRLLTPEQAKSNVDTVRKSFLNGKMINEYENARSNGKGEEYLKSVADKKPSYLSDTDYMSVTNNLLHYVNQQESLRNQDEQLQVAKFSTSIAMNPMAPDMPQQLQELKNNVSPEVYERAQLHYINTVKSFNRRNNETNVALGSWNDSRSFSRLSTESINNAFDMLTKRYMDQREQEGNPISQEEAQVIVASSAAGRIPVFEKELETGLLSGNPASIATYSAQIDTLNSLEARRVYSNISKKAQAIATQFNQQKGSMPDSDLARKIIDNLTNISGTVQKDLDHSWNLILSSHGAAGLGANKSFSDFALQQFSINKNQLGGSYFATIYGNDIYDELSSNFITTRGDYNAAVKMTQDYIDDHYGETYINGERQFTDTPIEKYLGYKGDDITPYVQQDLLNQLSESFKKDLLSKSSSDEYWEVLPLKNNVPEVIRHVNGKEYRYPVYLVGKAGNQWDVVVQTPNEVKNLFLLAPHVGVISYQPNREAIEKDNKTNSHKKKGWFE